MQMWNGWYLGGVAGKKMWEVVKSFTVLSLWTTAPYVRHVHTLKPAEGVRYYKQGYSGYCDYLSVGASSQHLDYQGPCTVGVSWELVDDPPSLNTQG